MAKFKVGDKVKYICDGGGIIVGTICTIEGYVNERLVNVKEYDFPIFEYRFELVKEKDEILMPREKSSAALGWGF